MLSLLRVGEHYLSEDFRLEEGEIAVLVKLPEPAHTVAQPRKLRVAMDEDVEQRIAPYKDVVMQLKHDPVVTQLVRVVHCVASDARKPFIVLESSFGMGKTQMAFNLMTREDMDVIYVGCEDTNVGESHHGVDAAFRSRSAAFTQLIRRDLAAM